MPDYPFGIIDMKVAPNDRTLFAVTQQGGLVPINLANGDAGNAIDVPGAIAVAIAPNGSTAYVVTGRKNTVTSIDLATDKIGKVIPLPSSNPAGTPSYVGIAPSQRVGLCQRR